MSDDDSLLGERITGDRFSDDPLRPDELAKLRHMTDVLIRNMMDKAEIEAMAQARIDAAIPPGMAGALRSIAAGVRMWFVWVPTILASAAVAGWDEILRIALEVLQ